MEAWVRIPPLAYFDFSIIRKYSVLMPTFSPFSRVQAFDATQLSRTSESKIVDFSTKRRPTFTNSKQSRMRVFLCKSKMSVLTFCALLSKSWRLVYLNACFSSLDNHIPLSSLKEVLLSFFSIISTIEMFDKYTVSLCLPSLEKR